MNKYEVWIEGYSATGENAPAQKLVNPNNDNGTWQSETFQEACKKALIELKWDMSYYNEKANSYWACRFFDNEIESRKDFG